MRFMVLVLLVSLVGCAARNALNKWTATLDPLVGQSRDSVLMVLGAPTDQIAGDSVEVWRYYMAKGESRTAISESISVGKARYDDISLYFRGKTLVRWTAKIER